MDDVNNGPEPGDAPLHEGPCCDSCLDDIAFGYGDDIRELEVCCCRALHNATYSRDADG
jgi:hypothetical protein